MRSLKPTHPEVYRVERLEIYGASLLYGTNCVDLAGPFRDGVGFEKPALDATVGFDNAFYFAHYFGSSPEGRFWGACYPKIGFAVAKVLVSDESSFHFAGTFGAVSSVRH